MRNVQVLEEARRSRSEAGVSGTCESPDVGSEILTWALQKSRESVLLATESSFQPLVFNFCKLDLSHDHI